MRAAGCIYTGVPHRRPGHVMPRVTCIEPDGHTRTLSVDAGSSVMRAAVAAGVDGIEAQ